MIQPGQIVQFRERKWVVLPSPSPDQWLLRPLTGLLEDAISVHKGVQQIISLSLPEEDLQLSHFPLPSPKDVSDTVAAKLLWNAARLMLRDGASPLRSLGRISIRPRLYQFVPLLMALRLAPVRLLIADDVGVGKTIEALLIARELFDRGEVRRMAVLCPPYLCDQWQKELEEKFHLESVILRSSTIRRLERQVPPDQNVYEYFPVQVISIDWVKGERNKHLFLEFCPELVIVDEAHGAAEASDRNKAQQQRHRLLRQVASDPSRHLILLTATPHSGIPTAFQSLLGLLNPEFRNWNISALSESQRITLARHFVQRTRRDLEKHWQAAPCFPKRLSQDATYRLSPLYRELFDAVYDFCFEIVTSGQNLEERKQRVRYWGALALLRCVMSSPLAAKTALEQRILRSLPKDLGEEDYLEHLLFEREGEEADDEMPVSVLKQTEQTFDAAARRRLRKLTKMAEKLLHSPDDTKLARCVELVQELLAQGFSPIIWCRFVATAEYVGEELRKVLPEPVQVAVITGRIEASERRTLVEELDPRKPRVLVATDCLSEGINLQEKFTAVIHYDLPWNPNRLEQREGRVDRYGQAAQEVKVVRFYGEDNPVDGAVLEVLLKKAEEIYKALGTYVPVPEESESVVQAVLNSLFLKRRSKDQLQLFEDPKLEHFHKQWEQEAKREKISRTRFAQRAIKPQEVQRELEEVDSVLGDPEAVRQFVLDATQRLRLSLEPDRKIPHLFHLVLEPQQLATLPLPIQAALPRSRKPSSPLHWHISFESPPPQGAQYVGRNHPFVAALAQYLFEEALEQGSQAKAARSGVVRTSRVSLLTFLLLLRVRYLLQIPEKSPLLAEEVMPLGIPFGETRPDRWLSTQEALTLLSAPSEGNIPLSEKQELVEMALEELGPWWQPSSPLQRGIQQKIEQRARELQASHRRIRKAVSLRIKELEVIPHFPPDLLALYLLQPKV